MNNTNFHMDIQKFCLEIGNYGCYLLSIMKALRRYCDEPKILEALAEDYDELKRRGIIGPECTVLLPEELCSYYGFYGIKVKKTKKWPSGTYSFVIGKYYNKNTGYSHFVLMEGPDEVKFDPLGNSKTVRDGHIESYRVFI